MAERKKHIGRGKVKGGITRFPERYGGPEGFELWDATIKYHPQRKKVYALGRKPGSPEVLIFRHLFNGGYGGGLGNVLEANIGNARGRISIEGPGIDINKTRREGTVAFVGTRGVWVTEKSSKGADIKEWLVSAVLKARGIDARAHGGLKDVKIE